MLERALKRLDPFTQLDRDALSTLARHARQVRLPPGRRIRAAGLARDWLGYLLDGSIRLEGGPGGIVVAGTPAALRPLLGGTCPAPAACTLTASRLLWVNVAPVAFLLECGSAVDMGLVWLDEAPEPTGWRERFLVRGLVNGRPTMLQDLFSALDPAVFEVNDQVLAAGAPGREFFIVADGRVEIRPIGAPAVVLGVGDAFGEEALLCGGRRNASAYALQRATLMRLEEGPFHSLLVPALVRWVRSDEVAPGSVVIDLDGPAGRCADPRQWLVRLSRAAPVVISGATASQRLLWAFLAARVGLNAAALAR